MIEASVRRFNPGLDYTFFSNEKEPFVLHLSDSNWKLADSRDIYMSHICFYGASLKMWMHLDQQSQIYYFIN